MTDTKDIVERLRLIADGHCIGKWWELAAEAAAEIVRLREEGQAMTSPSPAEKVSDLVAALAEERLRSKTLKWALRAIASVPLLGDGNEAGQRALQYAKDAIAADNGDIQ